MLTPKQKELLAAVTELKCLHQAIGKLGNALRRTKPGSKRHRAYYDALTQLERGGGL